MNSQIYHGGDLQEAETRFGKPNNGWLDLSTGINATAYPHTDVSVEALTRLPQPVAMEALLAAARQYYRAGDSCAIAAAPGSQSILQLLPGLLPARNVAVVGPTYGEHEKTWSDCGHNVSIVNDIADTKGADIVALVNPNNPDGRLVEIPTMLDLAHTLSARKGLLVIDEAFADVNPAASILPALDNAPVLVIRSFGKFFGLPGLRLGFAAGLPAFIEDLRQRLGPWPVPGPSIEIGIRALNDQDWIEDTRRALVRRCDALCAVLESAGLRSVGGTALFQLVEDDSATEVFTALGKAGIFVRRFPEDPRRLRFGVPGSETDLSRLQKALRCIRP